MTANNNRQISPIQAIAVSVGAMIGWGVFVMPSDLFLVKSTLLGSAVAFVFGTLLITLVARCYMNLMKLHSDEQGGVFWVRHYLGDRHAMIYGFCVLAGYLAIVALNTSAITLLLRNHLPADWQWLPLYRINDWQMFGSELIISSFVLVACAWINSKGIKHGALVQLIIAFLMVGAIIVLSVGSLWVAPHAYLPPLKSELGAFDSGSWLAILAIVPWAYVGFETTPNIAKNIATSKKQSTHIIYLSIFSGLVCYLLVNYFTALNVNFDYAAIKELSWATGAGVREQLGSAGMAILTLAMACSIISGINGFLLSALSLVESMNEQRVLPTFLFHGFHEQKPNPLIITMLTLLCLSMTLLGRNHLLTLVNIASLGIAFGFIYVILADIISQKQHKKRLRLSSCLALVVGAWFVWLVF
ncbi:APC family permease [Moraxella nasovis]|uniref:APC family permease n=1 Tax=Moraxella nasovis TaxID=2904121 RepID=UPI001F60BE98|nr:APC family permease [Moraxella nasovis]UNU74206.1 APC family permease [Moraxella nasovis]